MVDDNTTGLDMAGTIGTAGEAALGIAMADAYHDLVRSGVSPKQAISQVQNMPSFIAAGKVLGPIGLAASGSAEFGKASLIGTPEAYGTATGNLIGGVGFSALAVGAAVGLGIISAPISLPAIAIAGVAGFVGGSIGGFIGGKFG